MSPRVFGTSRELHACMMRFAILAAFAAACTGTYYPYPSQPTYATAQTQQVSQSADGTSTTTTTSTETYSFESNAPAAQPVAQPAVYQQPAPPQDDAPQSPPPSVCHPRDSANMCVAVQVIVDIGDILNDVHDGSCRDASRALNRYADAHAREIDTMLRLSELETPARMTAWEKRHRAQAEGVMAAALDLDTRCEHDTKLDRAFRRIGFTGLVGSAAL